MPRVRIPSSSTVYIDANILVVHFTPSKKPHKDSEKCRDFLDDVATGRIAGCVSTLALYETLDVLKRLVAGKNDKSPSKVDMERAETIIIQKLERMGIAISNMDESILRYNGKLMDERARELILETQSYHIQTQSRNEWKSLGLMDSLHCTWAERTCTHIISRDLGMKNIGMDVKPILLWEAY